MRKPSIFKKIGNHTVATQLPGKPVTIRPQGRLKAAIGKQMVQMIGFKQRNIGW